MKSQKLARNSVVRLYKQIQEMENEKGLHIKFAYSLARNKMYLKDEIEAISRAEIPPESYIEFEQKRLDLCQMYADKDEKGSPLITPQNVFVILENRDEFSKELNKLRDTYADVISEYEVWKVEHENFMKEEVEVTVHCAKLEHFPDDLSPSQIENFMPMISEDE